MSLIIKPTEACGWKCTFCSSSNITTEKSALLDHKYIFEFLKRFPETSTIILNGGDPLVLRPEYYWKIIHHLNKHNYPATLSFTTNLWPFYRNPEKWTPLFLDERVGVTTSFNYGNTRLIKNGIPYTEKMFWKVSNMMLDYIGYRPDFISVINNDNEDTAIDNVRLAKRMKVECKLNYAMASGEQSSPYQLSKIYKTYLEIYDLGLAQWEFNTKQMIKRLKTEDTVCPQSRKCDEGIRAFNPEGPAQYYSCGSIADDMDGHSIDYQQEVIEGKFFTPLQDNMDMVSMKEECLTCNLFNICNGCRKTIKDHKRHNMVEEHCRLMKTLAPKILELKA